jgi:UDP-N-acetylglucosamine--N-acetylmuramyl-(pentapeptide) pyrophosphoryl-undecaprenol N-acetylglucosamine transferase
VKIIISGGGSGGHIYPGIAIAEALKQRIRNAEIVFVGAKGKMEMEIVPLAGYPIIGLPIRSLERRWNKFSKNLLLPFQLLRSLWKAYQILKRFQPDIVIGTGGYASFPILYAAARRHIPIVLQEQNAYPGLANRWLAAYAAAICVAHEGMNNYFPPQKLIITGNPVRQSFTKLPDQATALSHFGFSTGQPTVLVLGGSLGAPAIIDTLLAALPDLMSQGLQLIISTGKAYFQRVSHKIPPLASVKIVPYITHMEKALAAADLVISRAGAMAIAEISLAKKPTIFIPSPHVAADHQTKNVLSLAAQGAALWIEEQAVSTRLIPTLLALAKDQKKQLSLIKNLEKHAKPQAAAHIATIVEKLIKQPT